MKLVVFGLAISSSWGNGHATLWRGLARALAARGHHFVFYERDAPHYASQRDLHALPGGRLELYSSWDAVRAMAARDVDDADAALVTSLCPDATTAEQLVLDSRAGVRAFYDLDTPVTLDQTARGAAVPYVGPRGLADYDLVLSCTGGASLEALRDRLGARRTVPLYTSIDPDVHRPVEPIKLFRADLSFLGTYAADRQRMLERLFHDTADRMPDRRFVLGGSQYPIDFAWSPNIFYLQHVAPYLHAAFYSSSRLTLNVTPGVMAEIGYCPPAGLFEAAACGAPILSDSWPGLDEFFAPGSEILVADTTDEAVAAIQESDETLRAVARRARERALAEHTATCRARQLEEIINNYVDSVAARVSVDAGDEVIGSLRSIQR